jgi:hypothetical protein
MTEISFKSVGFDRSRRIDPADALYAIKAAEAVERSNRDKRPVSL